MVNNQLTIRALNTFKYANGRYPCPYPLYNKSLNDGLDLCFHFIDDPASTPKPGGVCHTQCDTLVLAISLSPLCDVILYHVSLYSLLTSPIHSYEKYTSASPSIYRILRATSSQCRDAIPSALERHCPRDSCRQYLSSTGIHNFRLRLRQGSSAKKRAPYLRGIICAIRVDNISQVRESLFSAETKTRLGVEPNFEFPNLGPKHQP